jgi:hypothetical protein
VSISAGKFSFVLAPRALSDLACEFVGKGVYIRTDSERIKERWIEERERERVHIKVTGNPGKNGGQDETN